MPQEIYAKPELCKRINQSGIRTLPYRRGRQSAFKKVCAGRELTCRQAATAGHGLEIAMIHYSMLAVLPACIIRNMS